MPSTICPNCQVSLTLADDSEDMVCPSCGSSVILQQERTRTVVNEHKRLGKFELVDKVGAGAFGVVWKANDKELGRQVAVKIPHAGHLVSSAASERFFREGRSTAQLRHPGIVSVHEVSKYEGLPFLVSDFIAGVTLSDLLSSTHLDARDAAELVAHVADALHYAHAMGVVHRDIKPSNIMLDRSDVRARASESKALSGVERYGKPMLMDFGLALRHEFDEALTMDGQVLGTPAYMSPEQATGTGRDVDARSDVYSLGVVLYQLLTRELPFKGNARMLIDQVVRAEPRSLRSINAKIPRDLETITLKCMAKEKARRYQSAAEFAADLRRWLAGEPVKARPVGTVGRLWRWSKRNPVVAGLSAVVLMLLVGVTVASTVIALHLASVSRDLANARDDADRNAGNERTAREDAEKAMQLAKASADESRARLVQLNLSNGLKLMEERDLFGSAVWFAEALKLDQGNPEREAMHRLRLGAVLQQCPKLVHVWVPEKNSFNSVSFSGDGRRVLLSAQGLVLVCEVASGKIIFAIKDDPDIRQAVLSQDGNRVAVASQKENRGDIRAARVRVWDVTTGQPASDRIALGDAISSLEFTPDGKQVLTASQNQEVRLFDASTGKPASAVIKLPGYSLTATLSRDGKRVLTTTNIYQQNGPTKSEVRVWEAATGAPISRVFEHAGNIYHSAFAPNGESVAVAHAYDDGIVTLWDVAKGEKAAPEIKHSGSVQSVRFSPDGKRLATASSDRTARVWDAKTGAPISLPLKHPRWVSWAAFSPDGRYVLTASGDEFVRIWDAQDGELAGPPIKFDVNTGFQLSPDGRNLVTTGREAQCWDLARGAPDPLSVPFAPDRTQTVLSPDGQRMLVISDGAARLWDVVKNSTLSPSLAISGGWSWAFFSKNGDVVVTIGNDHSVRAWDSSSGQPLGQLLKHDGSVVRANLSADGRKLATCEDSGVVRIWDIAKGELICPAISLDTASVRDVTFDPQSERLFIGCNYYYRSGPEGLTSIGKSRLVSTATGKSISRSLKNWDPTAQMMAFTDDSRLMLLASERGVARILDATTGDAISKPIRHGADIVHAVFSRDGRTLVTASADWTARVWDVATGEPVTPPLKHDGGVKHCAISHDGRLILTCSDDDTARVWQAATGEPLTPPLRHVGTVLSGWFSEDSRRAFTHSTVGGGSEARVWNLMPDERPIDDLVMESRLLAKQRLDATGTFVPLEVETWRQGWAALSARYADRFTSQANDVLAWHRREADAAQNAKQWTGEIWRLDRLIASDSDNAEWHLRRAQANVEQEAWPAAAADYSKFLERHTNNADAWFRRGYVHARLGGWSKALADFEKTLSLDPKNAHGWLAQFIACSKLNQADRAAPAWAKAWESSDLLRFKGNDRFRNETLPVGEYQLLAKMLPEPREQGRTGSWLWGNRKIVPHEADIWIWKALGFIRFASEQWAKAVVDFSVVVDAKKADALILHARGAAYTSLEQSDKTAVADFTAALDSVKDDWRLWYRRGVSYQRMRRFQNAIDDLNKAIELNPSGNRSWWWRGIAYFDLKEIDKGIADLHKALQLGFSISLQDQNAVLLAASGDSSGYRRHCESLLGGVGESNEPNELNNAAWSSLYKPDGVVDFSSVVALAEKAVALRRDYVHLNTLGASLYRNGKYSECLKTLDEGMKLHGKGGIAWDWLFIAMAHHRLGHPEEAKRWLDKSRDWIQQIDAKKIQDPYVGQAMSWNHRLELHLFTREAEAMIEREARKP